VYGKRAMGIILTGMGDDGADGLLALYETGGLTVAQDRQSCIVYGMPKEAITRNAVDAALSLEQITYTLMRLADAVNGAQTESKTK
jgi:two-component system chemotaxis response regulator CheB